MFILLLGDTQAGTDTPPNTDQPLAQQTHQPNTTESIGQNTRVSQSLGAWEPDSRAQNF